MAKRHYYRFVKYHSYLDCWRTVDGIVIKCYTEDEVKQHYLASGEIWERIG